jgi:hypothetical protein
MLNPGTTNPAYPAVNTVNTPGTTQTSTPAAPTTSFNYTDLLKNDPILGQALAGFNASGVTNQAQLQAGQARALIQRGLVPQGTLPGVSQIDPTTAALAQQNTQAGTSVEAGLQRGYAQTRQANDASLAARGILRSGAYGQHAAEDLQGLNTGEYQADQATMDYLNGLYAGYQQQQQALQQSAVQSSQDALNRIIAQIQAGQLTGGTAEPPAPPPTPSAPVQWGLPPGQQAPDLQTPAVAQALANWTPPPPPTSFASARPTVTRNGVRVIS